MRPTIPIYLALLSSASLMTGCHNDDITFQDFDYRTVYFAYQTPVRTIILGDDPESDNRIDNEHACKIMATTGGGYSNPGNIVVRFTVDNDMVENLYFADSGEKIMPMPPHYYSLSSDQLEIPEGSIAGGVRVELSDAFFADRNALTTRYVIPLRMLHVTGGDSILRGKPAVADPSRFVASDWTVKPKDYILYCVKYINPWHGHYLRRGADMIVGTSGHESLTGPVVRHSSHVEDDEEIVLTSSAYRSVTMDLSLKDERGVNIPYTISIDFSDADDGTCAVSAPPQAGYTVSGTGRFVENGDRNSWGGKDRNALYLDYEVRLRQLTCHTTDTLVAHYRGVKKEEFTIEQR